MLKICFCIVILTHLDTNEDGSMAIKLKVIIRYTMSKVQIITICLHLLIIFLQLYIYIK